MKPDERHSALGLVLLGTLSEQPMHAYRLQKVMRQRGKGRVVNIRQRASVYQALDRLLRLGLISVEATVKTGRHPDRTIYAITDRGRQAVKAWLAQTLCATEPFPEFVAGLSMLSALTPQEAAAQLQVRARLIADELAEVDSNLRASSQELTHGPATIVEPSLARLFLIEEEYRHTMLTAQLRWLEGVIDDLRSGGLSWDEQRLREFAAAYEEQHS
jgi:DNA-binding PadR family transcriptional regulator